MKLIFPIGLLVLSMMYACSSSTKVYSSRDKSVDFSKYKTFDFYEIKEEHLKIKEVNRRRLAMAIELELGQKGIKKSVNEPDLLVNIYSLLNQTENTYSTNPSRVGYYGGVSPYGLGVGIVVSPESHTEYYTRGSVTIDLVDRQENKLVLEGVANIDAGNDEDADRIINYSVKKIFSEIPNTPR
ncbi:MAG: DUF4136 domain-containing protein [Cyclobacteriaceae bacterium]|nr:DUF4136 domain-containing protein [Cyclobacteriaceae bacterium]